LQLGGKIDETRTRFCAAMPASRKANSNEVRRSRCFPHAFGKEYLLGDHVLAQFSFLHE